MLVSVLRQNEEILLHLVYDLPTHYQIVYVRNFIHLFDNVRNFVRTCPKSIKIPSENFCPKIKCPKIKGPKILEINVGLGRRCLFHRVDYDINFILILAKAV